MHQLCVDAYLGTGGFYDKSYLYKFPREEDGFDDRKRYSDYHNQLGAIVGSIIMPVFGNEISRDNANDIEEAFISNCDGAGKTLDLFMEEVTTYHALLGNVFVIMDNYKQSPKRNVDIIEQRKFPYVYYKLPTEIHKYKKDKFGNLTEVEFYYETTKDKLGNKRVIYRHIDASVQYDFYKTNMHGGQCLVTEKVSSISDGLPVVMTGTEIMPIPSMLDLATIAKTVFNKQSELRQIERETNFVILQVPGMKPDETVEIQNLMWVPENGTRDGKFLTPDPGVMSGASESAEKAANALDKTAEKYGVVPITGEAKSGIAYAYEFAGNSSILVSYADTSEATEIKLFDMLSVVISTASKIEIKYDKVYVPGKTQLEEQKSVLIEVIDRDISPTLNKELNKKLVDVVNILGGVEMDEKTISQISTEIDTITGIGTLTKAALISSSPAVLTAIDREVVKIISVEVDDQQIVNDNLEIEDEYDV